MNALVEANKTYQGSIISSNGILFKNSNESTVLTAVVKDGAVDVTDNYSIIWYKDNVQVGTGTTITVNANEIDTKALYRFDAYDSTNVIRATAEVTVMGLKDGKDAILLYIDSSNGFTFKNTGVATTLTVTVIVADERLDSSVKLKNYFGQNAHLEWSVKKLGETTFSVIDSSDSRLSDDGFIFTLTVEDVKVKHTFNCDLIF